MFENGTSALQQVSKNLERGPFKVGVVTFSRIQLVIVAQQISGIRYYEPFVRRHQDNLLSVTAIVLANLCVAYVMTSANEEAEELMRLVEKEEEKLAEGSKPVGFLMGSDRGSYEVVSRMLGSYYFSSHASLPRGVRSFAF